MRTVVWLFLIFQMNQRVFLQFFFINKLFFADVAGEFFFQVNNSMLLHFMGIYKVFSTNITYNRLFVHVNQGVPSQETIVSKALAAYFATKRFYIEVNSLMSVHLINGGETLSTVWTGESLFVEMLILFVTF